MPYSVRNLTQIIIHSYFRHSHSSRTEVLRSQPEGLVLLQTLVRALLVCHFRKIRKHALIHHRSRRFASTPSDRDRIVRCCSLFFLLTLWCLVWSPCICTLRWSRLSEPLCHGYLISKRLKSSSRTLCEKCMKLSGLRSPRERTELSN